MHLQQKTTRDFLCAMMMDFFSFFIKFFFDWNDEEKGNQGHYTKKKLRFFNKTLERSQMDFFSLFLLIRNF